jgi:putative membrane protein
MAALVALSPSCLAQTATPNVDTGSKKMLSSADTSFAMKAAQGGLAEVQLGQLAVNKASNPAVKQFGQRMIDDHTKANDQLKQIAQEQNITLPETLNAKDQALHDKLQNLSGPQFDKEYMKAMVKDHEEDIKEFEKESDKGKDPAIKSFASQTLPTLKEHLEMAKTTDAQLTGKSS